MLLFHSNNCCTNKSECYVKLVLPLLLIPAFDKKLHHFVHPEQTDGKNQNVAFNKRMTKRCRENDKKSLNSSLIIYYVITIWK